MKDWSNQAVFSVLGYDCENESKHKLIGRVAFHVHKLVKVGLNVHIRLIVISILDNVLSQPSARAFTRQVTFV